MTMEQASVDERQAAMARDDYRRELGDALALRWSRPDDVDRVCELYSQVFRQSESSPPGWTTPLWTRDMFSGRHPHIGPRDFAVVEDTRSGKIVAATCLLRYTCAYEGIPFGFGRPELVATQVEYRNRGLIRAIFELLHARSAARGDLVQGITGIEYYYRQFGYEYAAPLFDQQGFTVSFAAIPPLKAGAAEPAILREATLDDVPLLRRLWQRATHGMGLTTEIEADFWRWAMAGVNPEALEGWRIYRIERPSGTPVPGEMTESSPGVRGDAAGAVVLAPLRWSSIIAVKLLLLDDGVSLVQALPSVLRGIQALAETVRPVREGTPPAAAIQFPWGGQALRNALADMPFAETPYPYAWYLRVADLPRFLRRIAPALEQRLAASAEAGYSGELTLDFYRGGLRLVFDRGTLTTIEDWRRPVWGEGNAGFPPLVFLQLLFGYRSLDDLRRAFTDVWAKGDATAVLDALFPPRPSLLIPLE